MSIFSASPPESWSIVSRQQRGSRRVVASGASAGDLAKAIWRRRFGEGDLAKAMALSSRMAQGRQHIDSNR